MDEVLEIVKNWDEDELIDLHEKIVNQINEYRRKKANEYEKMLSNIITKIQDDVYSVYFIDDEVKVDYENYEEALRRIG